MGKKLIIAEKPSVAADIARALGGFARKGDYFESDDYVLSSAVGHLLELAVPEEYDVKRGKWSFAHLPVIPPRFELALQHEGRERRIDEAQHPDLQDAGGREQERQGEQPAQPAASARYVGDIGCAHRASRRLRMALLAPIVVVPFVRVIDGIMPRHATAPHSPHGFPWPPTLPPTPANGLYRSPFTFRPASIRPSR